MTTSSPPNPGGLNHCPSGWFPLAVSARELSRRLNLMLEVGILKHFCFFVFDFVECIVISLYCAVVYSGCL